jgi:hypothetical protein
MCRDRVLPFTRLTPSLGGAKVHVRGLGKQWRGIVSLLAPVVVGVVLAYAWSAANTRMVAELRPHAGAHVTSQALAGHGPSSWSVDGTGATTEAPPLSSRANTGAAVAEDPHPGTTGPKRPALVVKSEHDKHHKRHLSFRADRGGADRVPRPRSSRPVIVAPTPDPVSTVIADNSGAARTPDHTRSVRLPYWKSSQTTKGGGACGGLHRSNSCKADPGFAR